jgi:hypothetical protein
VSLALFNGRQAAFFISGAQVSVEVTGDHPHMAA